jgi:hypothetical protein
VTVTASMNLAEILASFGKAPFVGAEGVDFIEHKMPLFWPRDWS